jgi:hypothetical protein
MMMAASKKAGEQELSTVDELIHDAAQVAMEKRQ